MTDASPGTGPDGPAGPTAEVAEPPGRRRLLRAALVVAGTVLAVLACWQEPGYAHDGIRVTVHHDGRGSVWIDTVWADGHPVTQPVVATMAASGAAGTVPPGPLVPLGPGSARYTGALPAGTWQVTVDVAAPGTGTCPATVQVGPEATGGSTTCGDSPVGQDARAGGRLPLLVGALGVLGTAATVLVLRRGRRPTAAPA